MSKQLIIHILEFTLSFIYVMLIWPVYEGEDYLWGCFICISYIIIIASYCIMRSLLPAMKIACDVYDIPTHTWKKLFFANIPIWATQKAMAQLFGIDKSGVSRHIANIYKDGELQQETTIAKIATVVNRGIRGEVEEQIDFYNLDVIIAVGYRVSSARATKFRQWATKILNEYIKKGFVLDEERLKQGTAVFGKDYFRELLEKVRSIRASERRIWQQITDIYAECSFDYDRKSPTTREFYQMVQNRFHYAIQDRPPQRLSTLVQTT